MSNNIWQWGILGIQSEQGYTLGNLTPGMMYALVDNEWKIVGFFECYGNTNDFIRLYLDNQSKADIIAGKMPNSMGLIYTITLFRNTIVDKLKERRIADVICKAMNSADLLVVEDLRYNKAKECISLFHTRHMGTSYMRDTVLECTFPAPEGSKKTFYYYVLNFGNYRDEDRITEYAFCSNGTETTVKFSE